MSVESVCFSPDGQRLASASWDKTIRVWDANTGKELLSLKGHIGPVDSVSFSPDGRRLASASIDHTIRVWDAKSGQILLVLEWHTSTTVDPHGLSVTFSPDGWTLATTGYDQTIRIWETSLTPDEVRRSRWLISYVHSLFEELGFREKVQAALGKETTLNEADRDFTLHLAQTHPEDHVRLNESAWEIVKSRDGDKDSYARALRHAEAAARVAPENGNILNTLGIAQYRAGRYADALATLTQSEKLNLDAVRGSQPADLAFLSMAQHQLGKRDESKATLGRLREILKQPRWKQDAESVGFLREAEELIEGKAAGKKK